MNFISFLINAKKPLFVKTTAFQLKEIQFLLGAKVLSVSISFHTAIRFY